MRIAAIKCLTTLSFISPAEKEAYPSEKYVDETKKKVCLLSFYEEQYHSGPLLVGPSCCHFVSTIIWMVDKQKTIPCSVTETRG